MINFDEFVKQVGQDIHRLANNRQGHQYASDLFVDIKPVRYYNASSQNRPSYWGICLAFSAKGHFVRESENWIYLIVLTTDHRLYLSVSINGGDFSGWQQVYHSGNFFRQHLTVETLKTTHPSYARRWKKLTATLPNAGGVLRVAHGLDIQKIAKVTGRVIDHQGMLVFNGDGDVSRNFYIQVDSTHVLVMVHVFANRLFGRTIHLYIDEDYGEG